MYALGVLYQDQGKSDEAEKMYRRALDGRGKAFGPDHTSTVDAANSLCILFLQRSLMKTSLSEGTNHNRSEDLKELIKLASTWKCRSVPSFGVLRRMLLRNSDELNAQIAFQQEIKVQEGAMVYLNVECGKCRLQVSCDMRRFICKQCQDIDLCGECFREHKLGVGPVQTCLDHSFLEITTEKLSDPHEDSDSTIEETE